MHRQNDQAGRPSVVHPNSEVILLSLLTETTESVKEKICHKTETQEAHRPWQYPFLTRRIYVRICIFFPHVFYINPSTS